MRKLILFPICFFIFASEVSAQIVINEVSPASEPEWVELFNTSETEEILTGCTLYFDDNHDSYFIDFSKYKPDPVGARSFFVVEKGEYGWSRNWLNNSGDNLYLDCGESKDSFNYKGSDSAKTWGRYPDGGEISEYEMEPSRGSENINPPTPTPKPTDTPKPDPTETPTPKPDPTSTPQPKADRPLVETPKPTKTPTPTPSPMPSPMALGASDLEESASDEAILALRNRLNTPTPDPAIEEPKDRPLNVPILAGVFVFSGLGLVSAAGYPLFKELRKSYTKNRGKAKFENQQTS